MLKEERYDKILEILDEETYTDAQSLSERLYVSMPTIRRDLAELSKRNLIVRSHGGAKKASTEHIVTPLNFRKSQSHAEKKKIARKAAALIADNDIVFIDASTTALHMGDYLSDKNNITVVTNGIPLSIALAEKGIKTYCTGGEIQKSSLGYAGSFAQLLTKSFNYDICFFSCCALTADGKIADTSIEENMMRSAAVQNSKKIVFLCDSSKPGLTAPYNLMNINEVSYIITDAEKVPGLCNKNKLIRV